MSNSKYELRYTPTFYNDLEEVTVYISERLNNTVAAAHLLDAMEKAILDRSSIAESFEPYVSKRNRKYPYYRIYVGNYTIFYVVIHEQDKKIMEVRRLLYNGRDRECLL